MKRSKIVTVLLLMFVAVVCAIGFVACDDGDVSNKQGLAYYLLDDDTYAVGAGNGKYLSKIEIPSNYNGKKISTFIDGAFDDAAAKELELKAEVNKIMGDPFSGSHIEKVTLKGKDVSVLIGDGNVSYAETPEDTTPFFAVLEYHDGKDGTLVARLSSYYGNVNGFYIEGAVNDVTDITAKSEVYGVNEYVNVKLGLYGKIENCFATVITDGDKEVKLTLNDVVITAEEYVFAPLNATYPVLVYSLKLRDITKDYTVPTFMFLERNKAYNWDKLPEGVSTLPTLKKEKGSSNDFHFLRKEMAKYIKELYELNNDSHFTLYTVDNYCETVLEMFVGNRIPEDNWNAVLLSDGTGTAGWLCSTFNVENPSAKYAEMAANWETLKEKVWEEGYSSEMVLKNTLYPAADSIYSILSRYAYVLAKEQDNISWWINRLRANENLSVINERDPAFVTDIIANTTAFYTNNLLSALSEEDAAAFKALYKFSDEMFKTAEESGKKVMIILGTSWGGEQASFYDYIRMTVELYGDEYAYYYKWHPGYATAVYPGRQEALNKLAEDGIMLEELDNAIAAEIILFFNPDVYICGWGSTTFESVENQAMACALYNSRYPSSSLAYHELIDVFFSKIASGSDSINGVTLDTEKEYYLMEYNNTEKYAPQVEEYNKHSFAIYNATDVEFKFYKVVEGSPVEVDKNGNII